MRILALNRGSSSLKCALVDTRVRARLYEAQVDAAPDSGDAVERLQAEAGRVGGRGAGPPDAVVHRFVHGGEVFADAVRVDAGVQSRLAALASLAPLHNPPALATLRSARELFAGVPHVAAFDTTFHRTLPDAARIYALPDSLRRAHGLRRYGFHGLSHANVMYAAARHLGRAPATLRIVSCHLGNGASLCAIDGGRSVETSMGMTPLEGLVMGTRAGDLDPGVLLELQRSGMDAEAIAQVLNHDSGLRALAGTHDMRRIEAQASAGVAAAQLALAMFVHRVRKYLGAYAATMGGVDVVAFTGGIGEHSATVRELCLQRLDFLGIVADAAANLACRVAPRPGPDVASIAAAGSRVHLLVVAADEEAQMAQQAAELLAR